MAIGADFSISTDGDIRHVSGTTTYTVLEFHRWLSDLADDATASGNDFVDITSDTPSERATDNIISLLGSYNIDDDTAQYLYDGSVSQSDGDELYSGLVVVGSTYSTTTLQIIQNNALYGGASPFWGTDLNADEAQNILMRCLVKTRTGASDVDGRRIRVQAREYGDTYAEFSVTMGLGNSVAAIFTNQDLNNQTAATTVSGWTSITNLNEGYNLIDLDNGAGSKPYYSKWDRDAYSINDLYEYAKYLTRRGATEDDLYGIDGELFRGITHEIPLTADTGTFSAFELVTWTGGSGQMLAIDSTTSPTKMWIQLLTGSIPGNGVTISGDSSSADATVNGSVVTRTLSSCFLGQSTGSAIIGAYGVGIEAADLTNNDKIFDLNNAQQIPPNLVTFTVNGVVSGEDRILVGPKDTGNAFEFDQLTLSGTLSAADVTSIEVTTAIPSDTPSAGTIRVQTDTGVYQRVVYSSWTGSIFTTPETDFSGDNAANGNNIFISYIDKLADGSPTATTATFQAIYSSDRALYIRVRDGGGSPIKTFESPSTLGSAGGSATATRTSDA